MAFGARFYGYDDRTGYLLVPARYANTLGAKPDHHCVIRDRGPIQPTIRAPRRSLEIARPRRSANVVHDPLVHRIGTLDRHMIEALAGEVHVGGPRHQRAPDVEIDGPYHIARHRAVRERVKR